MSDEAERARLDRLARRTRPPVPAARHPMFLGRVTSSAPAVGKFMKVLSLQLLGTETEGSAGSVTAQGTTPTEVYLVGPGVPATNDEVVATFVDYRWEAIRRAPTSPPPPPPPPPPACSSITVASIPASITLSLSTYDPPGGSPGARTICWPTTCGDLHTDPDLGFTFTHYDTNDPSGPYVYGAPPSDVASAFGAGYQAWFDPTPFLSTFPSNSNCIWYPRVYQYIAYHNAFSACYLYSGYCWAAYTNASGSFPAGSSSDGGGTHGWWFLDSGNTISPFYLVSRGSFCRGILTG